MSLTRFCHAVTRTLGHKRTLFSAKMRVGLTSDKAQNVSFCWEFKVSLVSAEAAGAATLSRADAVPRLATELSPLLAAKLRLIWRLGGTMEVGARFLRGAW